MTKGLPPRSRARQDAEALLLKVVRKQVPSYKRERAREHEAMVLKTARLRALRLAKEAAEREIAASAPGRKRAYGPKK